jgi:hypothetical protein
MKKTEGRNRGVPPASERVVGSSETSLPGERGHRLDARKPSFRCAIAAVAVVTQAPATHPAPSTRGPAPRTHPHTCMAPGHSGTRKATTRNAPLQRPRSRSLVSVASRFASKERGETGRAGAGAGLQSAWVGGARASWGESRRQLRVGFVPPCL